MRLIRGDSGSGSPSTIQRADDIGIHAGAADILAHLVDDEHIDIVDGQPRHQFARALQEALVAFDDRSGVEAFQLRHLVVAVFDHAETGEEVAGREQVLGDDGHIIAQADHALLMDRAGAPSPCPAQPPAS